MVRNKQMTGVQGAKARAEYTGAHGVGVAELFCVVLE